VGRRWWAVAAVMVLGLAAVPGLGWAEGEVPRYETRAECLEKHPEGCSRADGMWVPVGEIPTEGVEGTEHEYDEESLRRQAMSMDPGTSGTLQQPVVAVDKNQVIFPDVQPYLDLAIGRVRVPVRFISEQLGAHVAWDQSAQTVTITNEALRIQLTVDDPVVWVNGGEIEIDAPPTLLPPGRVMVPLRFISEAFGATVDWVGTESPDPMDSAWGDYQVWIWADWGYWGKYSIHERLVVQSNWLYRGQGR
jgi:hypothetical protein